MKVPMATAPGGVALDAADLQGRGQDAAKFAGRGHGRGPLPTGADAGRRIRSGNSDRAGAASRGSRRRACAMFCGLELCSARKHVMRRPAGPVEPCCHRRNITMEWIERYPERYPNTKMTYRRLVRRLKYWVKRVVIE